MSNEHSPGVIRAAEIITGGKYGEPSLYVTEYGKKTVEGIADIIQMESGNMCLLNALKECRDIIDNAIKPFIEEEG